MVKDAIATGATIEEAQQAAILALNAPEDADVQFEVIQFPEKKKFGLFGGKDAEVRAFYEAKEEKVKVAPVKKGSGAKKVSAQKKSEKKADTKKEKAAAPKKAAEEKGASPKKAEKAAEKAETPREPVSMEEAPEAVKKAYAYLKTVIEGLGIENYEINVTKAAKEYFFEVTSEDNYSLLIGRRGETLDSIQYLTRLAANRGKEDGKSVRISINVGDYREKRERTLKDIARKNGRRVRKYGRSMTLNPMNPSERRIIHTTVAEMEGLQSYSVGSDSERRVVIALAEGVEPLQQRNDRGGRGRNDRGGRGRNDRGGRGRNDRGGRGRNDRASSPAPEAPAREPRSDSAGSLYGIIAPKYDAEEIKAKAAEAKAAEAAEAAPADVVETAAAEAEVAAVNAEAFEAPAEAPVAAVENPVLSDAEPENFEVLYDAAPTEAPAEEPAE